jgi:hypothetical protein
MNLAMTNAAQNDASGLLFPILIALICIFVRLGKIHKTLKRENNTRLLARARQMFAPKTPPVA